MSADLERAMESTARQPSHPLDVGALPRRATRLKLQRLVAAGTVVMLFGGGGAFAVANWDRGPRYNTPVVTGTGQPLNTLDLVSRDPKFSIRYTSDWFRAEESLTPDLGDPKELVSLGTFPLEYRESDCAHLPGSAFEDMGLTDAFVTIQERQGGDLSDYQPRPLDLQRTFLQPSEGFECAPSDVRVYWMPFRDDSRAFYGLVAFGLGASAKTQEAAWAVMNSFSTTIEPRPDPSEGDINAPKVVNVTCGDRTHPATVDTDVVQPTARGIHLRIAPPEGNIEFFLRRADEPGDNQGGRLVGEGPNEIYHTSGPGDFLVVCHPKGEYPDYAETQGQGYAAFEVVDPFGLWVEPSLDCETERGGVFKVENTERKTTPRSVVPRKPTVMLRENVYGILETDQIIRPGYPKTQFHGEPRIVMRDAEGIAVVNIVYSVDEWELHVSRCAGADIGR